MTRVHAVLGRRRSHQGIARGWGKRRGDAVLRTYPFFLPEQKIHNEDGEKKRVVFFTVVAFVLRATERWDRTESRGAVHVPGRAWR